MTPFLFKIVLVTMAGGGYMFEGVGVWYCPGQRGRGALEVCYFQVHLENGTLDVGSQLYRLN